METLLTPCIKSIFEGREIRDPIFQIVEIKNLPSKEGQGPRYKIALNDGEYYCPAVLSSQITHLVAEKNLQVFQIIKIKTYNCVPKKKMLIIIDMDVLPNNVEGVIGEPSSYRGTSEDTQPAQLEASPSNEHSNNPTPAPMQQNPTPIRAPPAPPKPKPSRAPTSITPLSIETLTTYISNWTILARVIHKSPIKTWTNQKGSGKLFSIVLKDKKGGEIKGTFFNEEVDKFNDVVELDKVYLISGGKIRPANKKFTNIDHEYEISFDKSTTFTEANEESDSIGGVSYNFIKLKEIESMQVSTIVDILAVVSDVQQAEEIHSNKTNKDLTKRNLTLTDDSNATIECTLWGDEALNFPSTSVGQVISIKNAKVGEFNGKNISPSQESIIKFHDRSDPDAARLIDWFESNKDNVDSFEKISSGTGDFNTRMIFLDQINTQNLGKGEKPDYFSSYVYLKDIPLKRNIYYLSCPNKECKGKGVVKDGEKYICNACKNFTDNPVPRYAFSALLGDYSGTAFFNVLGEENGKNIIGMSAEEWRDQTDALEEKEKQAFIRPSYFKEFKIRGRAKNEEYNGDQRVKLYISSISEIDYADAAKFFAAEIKKF